MQNPSDKRPAQHQEKHLVVEEIGRKLGEIPDIRYEITPIHVIVYPLNDTGFTVELEVQNEHYILTFNGAWHDRISDHEEALSLFGFGLSKKCRLKVLLRGETEYRWTVQHLEDDKWVSVSTMGLLFFPFWRKKSILYLQNNILQ